jgi:hypothetical protein
MHRILSVRVAALGFIYLLFATAAPAQSLNDVLDAVSKNVKEFEDLLPDFVCSEKITSTEYDAGKVIKQKVVQSIFTGAQRLSEQNRVHFGFTESREVVAIDGKRVAKGTPFPKLPYRFAGGFSSLLTTTFSPENLELHTYSIGSSYKSGSSPTFLVQFATKENQQKLRGIFLGAQLLARDVGAAWVDQKSFRVVRLQRRSLNLPPSLTRSVATADYGPVIIGEREFWMPVKVQADVDERNSRLTVSYIAQYSDCRKFEADIKLLP